MIESFTVEQVETFRHDGFLVVEEGLVSERGLEWMAKLAGMSFPGFGC